MLIGMCAGVLTSIVKEYWFWSVPSLPYSDIQGWSLIVMFLGLAVVFGSILLNEALND